MNIKYIYFACIIIFISCGNKQKINNNNKIITANIEWENETHGFSIDKRDSVKYKVVNINNQVWMAENLAFKPDTGSWTFDNEEKNVVKYGRLYNWETAQNVCPDGWKLPTSNDFEILLKNLGGKGTKSYHELIKTGNSGFASPFSGWRYENGYFDDVTESSAMFWTSTISNSKNSWYLYINRFNESANVFDRGLNDWAFSVRCIIDN